MELGVKAVMKNNVYKFAEEIRVQEKGGGDRGQDDWRFGEVGNAFMG